MIPCGGRTEEDNAGDGTNDGRRGGKGRLISVRKNKRRILGL